MNNIGKMAMFFGCLFLPNLTFASLEIENHKKNILPYREGRLLVKVTDDATADVLVATADEVGASPSHAYNIVPGLWLYEYDDTLDIGHVIETFLDNDYVEYAEPDYLVTAQVNDPRFSSLWALENNGQTGGTVDADINANSMWAIEEGDPSVVVGVIDSGVNYNHEDLAPNMWRNTSEVASNGVDDDGNGYVDDIFGINAIANNGNPNDDNAHGSHCAGTIAAKGDNGLGVVGVGQHVKIAGCKFLGASGSGSVSDAIQCLQYFAQLKTRAVNPVNIVATNNSWGGGSRSTSLMEAIRSHQNLGILFIAAAGNDSNNNDVTPSYPASYNLPNVIAVAATDHNDSLASFSNYGKTTVHVGAPGVRILSTVLGQSYATFSGTSMATPHVSGLVAIIKSRFPDMDYRNVKNLVLSSGTPRSSLTNTTITGRRIRGADTNGRGALTCENQLVNKRLTPTANTLTTTIGSTIFLSAVRIICAEGAGPITLYSDEFQSITLQDNGTNGDQTANDGVYSLTWQPTRAGTFPLNFGNGDVVTVTVSGTTAQTYRASLVTYAYDSISGTRLNAGDETVDSVSIPFLVRFGGEAYNRIYISSNGTASFTDSANPGYANRTLPFNAFSTLVSPFWDDLMPASATSDIYVATTGSSPNRKFIVEWRNIRHYNYANGVGTFQVVFYENTPDVRFNYRDTYFGNSSYNYGRSATVGLQIRSDAATQYSFNTASVPSSRSILFRWQ